ncbi:response regulator transcription factor [Deinococcus rufus]|uniref:Response regulator transcription factor n=1 Tax=Deinococcus rufus TaxID=2136097 RepID=A0ABV7Z7U1_9DEIO
MRILLLEDEPNIARPVSRALGAQGHTVTHATSLANGRVALLEPPFDLLLLDVGLPDDDDGGFVLAQEARLAGYQGRILYLSARDALHDRLRGLDGGGDDYLVKPFDLPELLARVRVLLRRDVSPQGSRVSVGPLSVDFTTRDVHWCRRPVELTPREFSLLERFVLHPHRQYSSTELHDLIWGDEARDLGVVRQTVRRLRLRLSPEVIETLPAGYRLGALKTLGSADS